MLIYKQPHHNVKIGGVCFIFLSEAECIQRQILEILKSEVF